MNHIPVEKLKAEIERQRDDALERQKNLERIGQETVLNEMIAFELNKILSFIDSFQQEQSEELHFTPLNRLIQKIPSKNWNNTVNNYAKKLRDCLIKEGYLKDANVLQGYISYMNGNNVPMATMDEQEQPEVELEKEITPSLVENMLCEFGVQSIEDVDSECLADIARHFYELGLNTKKEE